MLSYYTCIIVISLFGLLVLGVLVHENGRIPGKDKRLYYLTLLIIGAAALSEWVGVQLDGVTGISSWPLRIVKCLDYTLTPMAGGGLVFLMSRRSLWQRILNVVLLLNTVLQIGACFGSGFLEIDVNNHYSAGTLYILYVAIYLVVLFLVIVAFYSYGKSFRRQNRASLYAIVGFLLLGIAMQEVLEGEIRTVYITLVIGLALFFIHHSEFIQIRMGDSLNALDLQLNVKDRQLSTDALTGLGSRYAYTDALNRYENPATLPGTFVAFSLDINGQKEVNDRYGHAVGDSLIRAAADCILSVFERPEVCFRTGGDEFIVLTEMSRKEAENALKDLTAMAGEKVFGSIRGVRLAAGYAFAADYPGLSAEKLVIEADHAMYRAKDAYYRRFGRRGRRR